MNTLALLPEHAESLEASRLEQLHRLFFADDFFSAYVECALWSTPAPWSSDQGSPMLDEVISALDLPLPILAQMYEDCEAFQETEAEFLAQAGDDSQNGHDFWLTREGHGVGFWDRGYLEPVSTRLTESSKAYGSGSDLFYQYEL